MKPRAPSDFTRFAAALVKGADVIQAVMHCQLLTRVLVSELHMHGGFRDIEQQRNDRPFDASAGRCKA
jgi:hypothetical protein